MSHSFVKGSKLLAGESLQLTRTHPRAPDPSPPSASRIDTLPTISRGAIVGFRKGVFGKGGLFKRVHNSKGYKDVRGPRNGNSTIPRDSREVRDHSRDSSRKPPCAMTLVFSRGAETIDTSQCLLQICGTSVDTSLLAATRVPPLVLNGSYGTHHYNNERLESLALKRLGSRLKTRLSDHSISPIAGSLSKSVC